MANTSLFTGFMLDAGDNTALALVALASGDIVGVATPAGPRELAVIEAVPRYHKFAVEEIAKGAPVTKGGEVIGVTSTVVAKGEHVHVHNLASARYRAGDVGAQVVGS